MQENFDIDKAIKDTSTFVRDKADVTMYSVAKKTSEVSAGIIMKFIYAVIIFLIFILLNIAACFVIKHIFFTSSIESIIYVIAFYALLLIILSVFYPYISCYISSKIAKKLVKKIGEINKGLDDISPEKLKREVKNVTEDLATNKREKKKGILELEKESIRKFQKSHKRFKNNLHYIKKNFKVIAFDIAKNKAILALSKNKYIGTLMGFIGIEPSRTNSIGDNDINKNTKFGRSQVNNNTKNWISLATTIGTSIFWSFAMAKAKKMIIERFFPSIAIKKKKKTLLNRIKTLF